MHDPITVLSDGTIKQVSPFNGTQVWTVPGRANRPFVNRDLLPEPIDWSLHGRFCSFCEYRYLDSPPEKARLVAECPPKDADNAPGSLEPDAPARHEASHHEASGRGDADRPHEPGGSAHPSSPSGMARPGAVEDASPRHCRSIPGYRRLRHVQASELTGTVAAFRRVPNLFPILPLSYWQANHGLSLDAESRAWRSRYLSEVAGRDHLRFVPHRLALAAGMSEAQWHSLSGESQLALSETFFGSCHDLIIGHRHFSDCATTTDQLASSGTLTPDEHAAYIAFTVESAEDLLRKNPFAVYIAIFQNWLRPAGASFDHLHKQLAAIDQLPVQYEAELARLRKNPDLYRDYGVDYAKRNRLIVASNDHAVAFAGYGHRYPSLEVHSLSAKGRPWELGDAELRGLSDLIHALHVASGVETPCNEEWHYRIPGSDLASPVRVVLKWRISTLAGFEGATKIYLNTMSPWSLRDRVVERLRECSTQLGRLTIG